MLYGLLKIALSYATKKYFVHINILNEDNIPTDKPVMLLPNHRSAFMDPIVIATQINRTTHFLVRGESFNNPTMVKIFNRLKMIPIYRREYDPDKIGQNEDIFKHCHQLMEKNGCLMIFPEGICQTKFILAPLKSGTARIALEAEAKNNFELDIHLIPIGINYSNPHRFRGNLTIDIGNPIVASAYKSSYETDSWEAVNELTNDVETELKKRIITLDNQDQMRTVRHIEKLFVGKQSNFAFEKGDWHQTRQGINDFIEKQKLKDPKAFEVFESKLERYIGALQRLGVEKNVSMISQSSATITKRITIKTVLLILGYPVYILGYLMHFVPFKLTQFLSLKLVRRVDFMGSVALSLGLLIFTIFGIGETVIVHKIIGLWWLTIAFILVWPSLGLFAYGYLAEWVKLREAMRWIRSGAKKLSLVQQIKAEKEDLISYLNSAVTS